MDWAKIYSSLNNRKNIGFRLYNDGNINFALALNESLAGIAFPDTRGRVNLNYSFMSNNDSFHKWCHELYMLYWNNSKQIKSLT